jgi:hypothetical protein
MGTCGGEFFVDRRMLIVLTLDPFGGKIEIDTEFGGNI